MRNFSALRGKSTGKEAVKEHLIVRIDGGDSQSGAVLKVRLLRPDENKYAQLARRCDRLGKRCAAVKASWGGLLDFHAGLPEGREVRIVNGHLLHPLGVAQL